MSIVCKLFNKSRLNLPDVLEFMPLKKKNNEISGDGRNIIVSFLIAKHLTMETFRSQFPESVYMENGITLFQSLV